MQYASHWSSFRKIAPSLTSPPLKRPANGRKKKVSVYVVTNLIIWLGKSGSKNSIPKSILFEISDNVAFLANCPKRQRSWIVNQLFLKRSSATPIRLLPYVFGLMNRPCEEGV